MEQPQKGDPHSGWERMQSRPRFRWLVDKTSRIAAMTRDALAEEQPASYEPVVILGSESFELSDEELEERYRQRVQEDIAREGRLKTLIQTPADRRLDALEYARYRLEQPDWLTMEIGPGNYPNAITGRKFKGKSAYIGIENYSFPEYSDKADAAFKELRKTRPDENIFLRSDPNFGIRYPKEKYEYYDFPDATADEIYVSQVYDKPGFGLRNDDEESMTNEIARLLKPGGKALIFDYDRNLEDIAGWLTGAGLELRFVLRQYSTDPVTGSSIVLSRELREMQVELDCAEGDLILIAEKPADWTRASASRIHAPFYPVPSGR